MNTRIVALYEILVLNTRLFEHALEGVNDSAAQERPAGANSIGFVACHLLDARAFLADLLGIQYTMPYRELFDAAGGVNELELPPVDGLRSAWREVSDLLIGAFPEIKEARLAERAGQEFPVDDRSVLGGTAFLLQHESFHLGQLALLRRQVGLGPMSY